MQAEPVEAREMQAELPEPMAMQAETAETRAMQAELPEPMAAMAKTAEHVGDAGGAGRGEGDAGGAA